jgi:gluconolactonase
MNLRTRNPLHAWQVDRHAIRMRGQDLQRPECILAEHDGTLWTADARGVMRIASDGTQTLIRQRMNDADVGVGANVAGQDKPRDAASVILGGSLPNGIAFNAAGDILIANFGTDAIELMQRDGRSRALLDRIDGQPLGKTNFVLVDSKGRTWFTVTTREVPWTKSINAKTADGWVGVMDEHGRARLVADGFVGTNECRFDANEEWLYVAETNARRISRLRIDAHGYAVAREVYGPSDLGGFPDGFAIDAFGNLWITLVLTERLIALTPEGEVITLLDDGNPEALGIYEAHYQAGTTTPELMGACRGTLAPMMASVTFGGPDLRTVVLGSLMGSVLPCFRSPVAGLAPTHWNAPWAARPQ